MKPPQFNAKTKKKNKKNSLSICCPKVKDFVTTVQKQIHVATDFVWVCDVCVFVRLLNLTVHYTESYGHTHTVTLQTIQYKKKRSIHCKK